jgi:hypothetical protein
LTKLGAQRKEALIVPKERSTVRRMGPDAPLTELRIGSIERPTVLKTDSIEQSTELAMPPTVVWIVRDAKSTVASIGPIAPPTGVRIDWIGRSTVALTDLTRDVDPFETRSAIRFAEPWKARAGLPVAAG